MTVSLRAPISGYTKASTCPHCRNTVEQTARFCGECGAMNHQQQSGQKARPSAEESFAASFQRTAPLAAPHYANTANPQAAANLAPAAVQQHPATPNFARLTKRNKPIPNALNDEIRDLIINLARERMFLVMHTCVFLGTNLLGLYLAMVAYNGYIGDEMTKTVMAFTPIFFINSVALACLAPIKGTKREIQRLKERLTYMKYQVEYLNMF